MNNHQDDQFKKIRKNFLITQSQAQALENEQQTNGISQSEVIRAALDIYFRNGDGKPLSRERKLKK